MVTRDQRKFNVSKVDRINGNHRRDRHPDYRSGSSFLTS